MLNKKVAAPRNICTRYLKYLNAIIGELNSGPQLVDCNGSVTVVLVVGDSLRSYRAKLKNVCMYIILS
jgi:hypothetical protein